MLLPLYPFADNFGGIDFDAKTTENKFLYSKAESIKW